LEVIAGTMGGLTGVLGFVPFYLFNHKTSRRLIKDSSKAFRFAMVAPLISFALILAGIISCWLLAPGYLVIFAVACITVFLVGIAFFVVRLLKAEK